MKTVEKDFCNWPDWPEEQKKRYLRQIALPEIGSSGQQRLRQARVLIIGMGGLGSAAGFYLAAAGVGTLGIVDDDKVEESNLQRQILYRTADVGRLKIEAAAETLRALEPHLQMECHCLRVTAANARDLCQRYDFVVEATDDFITKLEIAKICHAVGRPYSYAGVLRYYGQTMTVLPGRTACLHCLFGDAADNSARDREPSAGPLGALPGLLGCLQAAEALKYLLQIGDLLTDRLLTCDILTMQFRIVPVNRFPDCRVCGENCADVNRRNP